MSDDTPTRIEPTDKNLEETPAAVPGSTSTAESTDSGREPEATNSGSIPPLVEPPAAPPAAAASAARDSTWAPGPESASEPEQVAEPATVERVTSEAGPAEPVASETVAAAPETQAETVPAVQTVYVTAPTPPRTRGNRGFGTLMAIAATLIFAVLLALLAAVYRGVAGGDGLAAAFTDWLPGFVAGPLFYVPVVVFLVLFLLLALLVNRAGWGVYVLGSFLLAIALYFASIGLLLALDGMLVHTTGSATFAGLAVNPAIIIATVLAREVAIWFGAAVSARGRRVKAKNLEAVAAYERETDERNAERERVQYGTVS